jgi:hypothetical protein
MDIGVGLPTPVPLQDTPVHLCDGPRAWISPQISTLTLGTFFYIQRLTKEQRSKKFRSSTNSGGRHVILNNVQLVLNLKSESLAFCFHLERMILFLGIHSCTCPLEWQTPSNWSKKGTQRGDFNSKIVHKLQTQPCALTLKEEQDITCSEFQ